MKKTLALLLTVCLFLTACASVPQDDLPAQRALEFCTKIAAFDFDGAVVLFYPGPSYYGEDEHEPWPWEADPSLYQMVEAMKAYTTQNTVTIKDSKVEGGRAVVTVSVEYIDLGGRLADLLDAAMAADTAQELIPDDIEGLSEEESLQIVRDVLVAYAPNHKFEKVTADYVVSLKKDGDDWFVVDAEEELLLALISNIGRK